MCIPVITAQALLQLHSVSFRRCVADYAGGAQVHVARALAMRWNAVFLAHTGGGGWGDKEMG